MYSTCEWFTSVAWVLLNLKKSELMSLPTWRKTHYTRKNDGYFDYKRLKICARIGISYIFASIMFRGHY